MLEGIDTAALMYGQHAKQVPAWMYVQNHGSGTVSFVGSSRNLDGEAHPLRFGSERSHQLVVGEIIVRPHYVIGTDSLRGTGLGGLATSGHDITAMLDQGEIVLDTVGRFS